MIQLSQFLYRVTAPGIRVPAVLSRQLQPAKSFATPGCRLLALVSKAPKGIDPARRTIANICAATPDRTLARRFRGRKVRD